MKKNHIKLITIVLFAFLCGSFATYSATSIIFDVQQNAKDFRNLTNVLIKIRSASESGLNQKEWTDLYKELLTAKDIYIMSSNPSPEEREILKNISDFMNRTKGYWEIPVFCYNDSAECIKKYASASYDVIPDPEVSREEYISKEEKKIKESGKTTEEDRKETISVFMTFTGAFIQKFFIFHKISL